MTTAEKVSRTLKRRPAAGFVSSELATELGTPVSTVRGVLRLLEASGEVERAGTKHTRHRPAVIWRIAA